MRKVKLVFIVISVIATGIIFSQPGTLDSSYADNGKVLTLYTPEIFAPDASIIQQNDFVVLMGRFGIPNSGINKIGLSRHKTDGTIDNGFGTNGFVSVNVNNKTFGNAIALQADQKIVVAGYILNPSNSVSLLVIRFKTDGSLDTTFGVNGIAVFNNNMTAYSVKIQSDNKIVVGGKCGSDFAVARLNLDGSIDEDFGFNGLMTTTITTNSYSSQINAISLVNGGKIIASGYTYLNPVNICFCIVQYDANGIIDTSFGINGKVITDLNPTGTEMITAQAIQQDGKIVVTGSANASTVVARYNSNGTLDNLFGTNGVSTTTFGNASLSLSLLIQPDNKIVIVGISLAPNNSHLIARYTADGNLDSSFNNVGYNLVSFGDYDSYFNSVLLQSDGKLIATGFTQIVNDLYTVIARFNSGLLNTNEFDYDKIKIYPNPTEGILSFNTTYNFKSAIVINHLGQQILTVSDLSEGFVNLDLSNLSSGTYVLRLEGQYRIYHARLIKR